jgi:phosphoribosylformimino-5-aminoimidazole carboxamide ribotide isomerase
VILFPALDILDGHVVRLAQGDFDRRTDYGEDPVEAAKRWAAEGAEWLHVVDLDGARAGNPVNLASLRAIVRETGLAIQTGGGLRSIAAIDAALAAGAQRVIIGTAAFTDPALLDQALERHGARVVVVSVDARGGMVATSGWLETTELGAVDAVSALAARGVRSVIYTDIDRDGMLGALDLDTLRAIADAARGEVIYAGGIGSLEDLQALAQLGHPRIAGVISGKALYEGRFTLAQANAALCS